LPIPILVRVFGKVRAEAVVRWDSLKQALEVATKIETERIIGSVAIGAIDLVDG
jgi:hypothetical protein